MAAADESDNVIPFAEHAITSPDLRQRAELTKVSLVDLMDVIESCDYEGEPGPLVNSLEWLELKRRLGLPPTFSPNAAS
jgi:hypothetical protein